MRTTDKNKRYPIPEFHYEISRNGELWNTNTGRLIRPGSDGRYLVRHINSKCFKKKLGKWKS